MIYIPLIYFSVLTIILYTRHRQIDLAAIISMIFAVSAFFSVLLYNSQIAEFGTPSQDISFFSTILYCVLISICIFPIAYSNVTNRTNMQPIRNTGLLKFISVISLIWFILLVIQGWAVLNYVLVSGDMGEIRSDIYSGYGVGVGFSFKVPFPIDLFQVTLNLFFGAPWILQFLGFYSMVGNRIPIRYSIFLFVASLSGPIFGIMGADRSATAYWILSFAALYLLFNRQLSAKATKFMKVFGIVVLTFLISYLVSMTISRFGDKEMSGGALGSIVSYIGQVYINFCYFLENYELPYHHFGILFPFTSTYIFGVPAGGVVIQEEMTMLTNMETGVFYTFIGQIMVGIGQIGAIIFTILYAIASSLYMGRLRRIKNLSIDSLYTYFVFTSVILLGVFGHYYAEPTKSISMIVMFFLIRLLK